ncbi:membrane dipeptidase [uncultured Maritimibacter sp.]|jgi:microsomal dipeptidase-like Zn-dependent dipeptidase|uniref:dipeptidase n=1 Tax=uncultured Maritimibacter sp. TaxID=991866 RepID=UPI000B0DA08B|nr:membrane dipeptidase [uncultured Maritimibacter sp.]
MRILKWLAGIVLIAVILGVIGFFGFAPRIAEKGMNAVKDHDPYPVSAEAQNLHDSLLIGDWHVDTLLWNRDLLDRGSYGQVDIPRLQEGNVALQMFTSVTKTPAGQNYEENTAEARDNVTLLAIGQLWPIRTWFSLTERALYHAERLHRAADRSDGTFRVLTSEADLDTFLADRETNPNLVGGFLGMEGGHALEGDIAALDILYAAGHRLMGLQHFFDNELGGSLHGVAGAGLTDFGREVVTKLETDGWIIDLAHSSQQTARDVLAMTDVPLIVSHTGVHSHCETVRNYPDDLMRDIAATGGVVGIGYWADVTCDDSPKGIAAAVAAAIAAVGEDHVSLGSDFDGAIEAALDTSELAAITQAMLDAGLSETQIRKVAGENMIRVLRARLD